MALQPKFGQALGQASYLPGQPGGPGGPGGPPAPGAGSGWEVRVLLAPAYQVLLAVLPPKAVAGFQFVKQLKDKGSGSVTLNLDDKFWTSVTLPNGQPAHYLLDFEHVWQLFQDGVPRFEFLGETVTEQLSDASEQRTATVAGPGAVAALAWAMAAPPGFPSAVTYKLDALTDSFSAVDGSGNFVIDYGLWNASQNTARISVNPSGSARLMGSPGNTIMGTTAYDATGTLISAQVSPIVSPDAAGANLNGSQVTQMYVQSLANPAYYALLGLSATVFYAQLAGPAGTFTHTIATATAFNAVAQGTNGYAFWQISENNGTFFFWTSSDGQNWARQWQVDHHWDATQAGLYFLAKYSADNTEAATVTGINTNVSTSSLGGPLYLGRPIISAWLDLLSKAKARGTVPFIATGQLSAATDSFGNPWTDSQSVQIQNGTDLLALLQAHASMINADWIMQPGFRLQVGIPTTGAITLGFDRSGQVIFRDGEDCAAKVRTRARASIQNLLGVINSDGRTITAADATSESTWGQREGWLQAAMQVSQADLAVVATAADLENASEVASYTLTVSPYRPGRTVFTGYDVGDWVGLERPDFSAVDKVRVAAIAVQVDGSGAETHELTVGTYIQWLSEQLAYITTKMGGGFLSAAGTTAIAGNGQDGLNAPTIASPTLPGLAGVTAGGPGGNTPLVYDPNTGQWVPAGTVNPDTGLPANVVIAGTGGTVTVAGNGSSVTVSNTPQPPADGGGPPPAPGGQVIGIATTTITDATGTSRTVVGAQPDGTYTSKDFGGAPPAAPDTPGVAGTLNGILVTWDGLIAAAAPLSDFLWCEVHVSVTSGFTPTSATLKGTLVSAAVFPVAGLAVGTTYFARLMARNTSGVAGPPSVQASGVPSSLTASLVGQLGVLNANPYFSGGDGSTWASFNGTFSVSASPPAGTPDPYAGFFTITAAGSSAALEESGQPFRVAGSVPYLVTAWVYSSNTSAVIGFTWQDSSHTLISRSQQTFTVTASTWTLVTTVQTSPPSAVWAFPRVAPGDVLSATIYAEAVLCLPQVPGALVQAGTITASQIAANTITAAQIASNTITASQIAANTITAAQIAAGTITASQIAAGTITASLLSAGIVKAGIVDGTSISAAHFVAYGTNGEILVYSGTPAAGNLIAASSGAAGSDSFGNSWGRGNSSFGASGAATEIDGAVVGVYSGTTQRGAFSPAGLFIRDTAGTSLLAALAPASGTDSPSSTAYQAGVTVPSGVIAIGPVASTPSGVSGLGILYCGGGATAPFWMDEFGIGAAIDRGQVNTSTFTLSNTTTTETQFSSSFNLPAGGAEPGSELVCVIQGNGTWPNAVLTLHVNMDGNLFCTTPIGAAIVGSGVACAFRIEASITFVTAGGAGSSLLCSFGGDIVNSSGNRNYNPTATSGGAPVVGFSSNTYSSSVSHTFEISGSFASGGSSASIVTQATRWNLRGGLG